LVTFVVIKVAMFQSYEHINRLNGVVRYGHISHVKVGGRFLKPT